MARALNWDKDRRCQLAKRAIAEEYEDQSCLRSFNKKPVHRSKQADRELADAIAREYQIGRGLRDPRGAWHVCCDECETSFEVKLALSVALETKSQCPKCKVEHWLTEEDVKLPW